MRVAVIGAGVFGAWSAHFLARAGHRVTLLDAYGPANARASSADRSRVIRAGYGADDIYSRWASAAFDDWRTLERETKQRLLTVTGALFMGAPGDAYVHATAETLRRLGRDAALLTPGEVQRRFPQIAVQDLGDSVWEPDAGALRAIAAIHALVRRMRASRAVEYRRLRVLPPDEDARTPMMVTEPAGGVEADVYVFACGPWLSQMFPQAVGARLRVTRQEVLYFGVPPSDDSFGVSRLPVWIDFQAGVYGIPDLDARGFKVGIDRHGPPLDPDTADRIVDRTIVEATRAWLATRFPRLAAAPLLDAHVCQYENTSTGDFIVDRHPQWRNVWIVGGGSGHGFKHGPSLGRYVAALIAGDARVEPRFSLAGRGVTAARSVF